MFWFAVVSVAVVALLAFPRKGCGVESPPHKLRYGQRASPDRGPVAGGRRSSSSSVS